MDNGALTAETDKKKTKKTNEKKSSPKKNKPKPETKKKSAPEKKPAKSSKTSEAAKKEVKKEAPKKRSGKKQLSPIKIIPLGGLGEIGKNMTLIEYEDDIIIIDCGLAFPEDDMPGIDLVIPDFSYVAKNRDRIRGVVVTHGHEDHIGALSYLLKEVNVPVYSARLTIGLIEGKLKEAGILRDADLHVVKAGEQVRLGRLTVEFITVNHSIPDSCALAIFTPAGTLVHTGDFKIDFTPVDGQMIDLARFGELGSQGVLALMSDSTNAERPGLTASESRVGRTFATLFERAGDRRIIAATFSSNVHRIQQFITMAERYGRKVVVSGRSMENVTAKAIELGYLKVKPDTLVSIDDMRRIPDEHLAIVTTGSQGEPMSALTRMARGDHRKISVTSHDFIIISATPIPGNEKLVSKVINELMRLGADVVYESAVGVHVSGHGCQEDIKTILGLTKPKYFIPVHGEFKHLAKNREIAVEMGMPADNVFVGENGWVIEVDENGLRSNTNVPSGAILVDGSGVGDVGSIVLRDRRMLADEGLVIAVAALDQKTGEICAGPDIISRGFVYVRESEELIAEASAICRNAIERAAEQGNIREWQGIKQAVKDQLSAFIFQRTKRRPMILPIIQEIQRDL
ncbi:MAG: ribonuclease J [Oscillospiraceae bacterium]|nr:ribonuclease J [Oscillospiraceae bacterium]